MLRFLATWDTGLAIKELSRHQKTCYTDSSRSRRMLSTVSSLPATGQALLLITTSLFIWSLVLGWQLRKSTTDIVSRLTKCVRSGEDSFDNSMGIIQEIRGSYRSKMSQLESIDTASLVATHLNKWTIFKVGTAHATFQQVAAFLSSSPSYLVTLGLIGTFLGLIENLSELSGLLAASNANQMSDLLGSMGTAFTVSLFGVSFSLAVWLWEHILGIDTIEDRLISLASAYLDGVVQKDVKRFSLVGEAVARIETYLSDFLANFTERVGSAIDRAMRDKLDEVFDTLNMMAITTSDVIKKMDSGASRYEASSSLFKQSAEIVIKPNLAQSVVAAAKQITSSSNNFAEHTASLAGHASSLCEAMNAVNGTWRNQSDAIMDMVQKNHSLLHASTELARGIEHSSNSIGESLSAIEEAMPTLEASIKSSNDARVDAQLIMEETKMAVSSLASATSLSAQVSSDISSAASEIRSAIDTLSEILADLEKAK